ncbi:MAG: SRPBCC family protein [Anaerolineae bacterium]|nr:SRPBCC family protein [Anaerolineae bacterium]
MGHVNYTEEINAAPEQVWAVLADVTRLPNWTYTEGRFPYPVEGKYGSDQKEGPDTIWIGVSNDGQTATQKVTVWEPNQKLVYELQEMENAPLQMTQTNTFALEAMDGKTKVTWSLDWELTGGFSLSKLLIRFTGNGAFEEMIAGSLENLKQLVEKETAPPNPPETEPGG